MLLQKKRGNPFSEKSLSAFDTLGPMIGPLNFPGFGKNLYLRLIVPPDEEEANYVTVHLAIKPGSIPFAGNYNNGKFFPRKPWLGKLTVNEETIEEPNIPLEKKPFDHLIAQEFVGPKEMNWNPMHQVSFGFNASPPPPPPSQPEQRAAPNHRQLPIVHRNLEKLNDLPIYPPLSALRPGDENRGAVRDSGSTEVQIFPRIMQNSVGSSKYVYPAGSSQRGGMESKNFGSGHVLTTGHSGDPMIRNVVPSQNPKHSSNNEISVTEGPRKTSRVNDTPTLRNIKSDERDKN